MYCPKCKSEVANNAKFCNVCGLNLEEIKNKNELLENDPELKAMNDKYAKTSLIRFVAGVAAVLGVLMVYYWLENNASDILFDLGFPLFFVGLLTFIVTSVMRSSQRKNLKQKLNAKIGKNEGNNV